MLPDGASVSSSSSATSAAQLRAQLEQNFTAGGLTINKTSWEVLAAIGLVLFALLFLWLKLS